MDPARPDERLLRAVPAVARDERLPRRREAHLDLLDRVLLLHRDAEAVGEDPLRVVAVLVRIRERPAHRLRGFDAREPVRVGIGTARPPDDVELVIVDGERERLDAHRAPRALEVAVADLQRPPPL